MDAKNIYKTLCLFVIFCGENLFAEGPLLLKNQVYTKLSWQNYSTDRVFDREGHVRDNCNHFLQNKYCFEADYGITNEDTISGIFGFTRVEEKLDGTTEGFNDCRLFLKHAFIKERHQILSLEAMLTIPVKGYVPAVRYGDFGAGLMLYYGVSGCLNSYPVLLSLGAGGAHYTNVAEDFLKFYTRLALCPINRITLRTTFRLDYGLNNGKHLCNASLVDFNPNERVLRGEFEIIYKPLCCLEFTAGYFSNLWGRNVGYGGGFIGSMAFCF